MRQPLDLLDRLLGGLERGWVARVDRLDLADQRFQRAEPALEHQDVEEQGEDDRHREQRELEPLVVESRSRLDAALAANSAATTSRRFAVMIWPLRDSRFFICFASFTHAPASKMGFRPHIGTRRTDNDCNDFAAWGRWAPSARCDLGETPYNGVIMYSHFGTRVEFRPGGLTAWDLDGARRRPHRARPHSFSPLSTPR